MEIISGNPNVNKSLTDLGMREDRERLEEESYSRQIKQNKGRTEMKAEPSGTDKQAQCV